LLALLQAKTFTRCAAVVRRWE